MQEVLKQIANTLKMFGNVLQGLFSGTDELDVEHLAAKGEKLLAWAESTLKFYPSENITSWIIQPVALTN